MPNPYLPLWEYIPDGEPRVLATACMSTARMTESGTTNSAIMC